MIAALALAVLTPGLQVVDPGDSDDRRDVVHTTGNGRPVLGRVVTPYDPGEILILQGGKRVRVPRDRVDSMDTVPQRLAEFFARRDRGDIDRVNYQWILAEWVASRELDRMAALQAYHVLLLDPDHERAHASLGHVRAGGGEGPWMWRRDGDLVSKSRFDELNADWGKGLILESEHWRLRTDAGLRRAIDTLFDLERLYVFWMSEFGAALNLQEVLKPMEVHAWKDVDAFPGWTMMRLPYYFPRPYQDTAYTFFEGDQGRAKNLFRVGTEHILNRSLVVDGDPGSYKNRFCAWLELGLGQWVEARLGGPPGQASRKDPEPDPERARLVLEKGRYELPNLLNCTVRDSYYAGVTDYNEADWAYCHMFVEFLMEDRTTGGLAERLLKYAFEALRRKRGSGSSTFDDAFGQRIETLQAPFTEWLEKRAGAAPSPSRRRQ